MKKSLFNLKVISVILCLLSASLTFFSGAFSNDMPIESISEHFSEIVTNNTINKKYCAVTVQSTEDSGSIAQHDNEFYNLYGIFKQRKITFASALNLYNSSIGDKDHQIIIEKDNIKLSDNLSIFYCGPVGTEKYNNHYKHYVYPFETMFEDDRSKYDLVPGKYVIYISQTHANKLLESYGVSPDPSTGKYETEQYNELLTNPSMYIVDISFDSVPYKFAIMNIFYQTNYYYEGVSEVLGDFVLSSYYTPLDLKKEHKNIYFFNNYNYQNKYFMEHLNSVYSNKKYKVDINMFNIIGDVNKDYLLSFYYGDMNNNLSWLTILTVLFSFIFLAMSIFLCFKNKMFNDHIFNFATISLMLLVYGVFWIIYLATRSTLFFTNLSCSLFLIIVSLWCVAYFIMKSVSRKKKKNIDNFTGHYEVNI